MTFPFFSIITPTLQRDSLIETCRTIDTQTFQNFQHVIMVDQEEFNLSVLDKISSDKRIIAKCHFPHRNGGNTCRHNAFSLTSGEWIYFLDDDNFLADDRVLEDVHTAIMDFPTEIKWALFPITRVGHRFYADPPRSCHVDTLNFILRREVGQWPDTTAYGSDGVLVDDLMARGIPYKAFPDFRPIAVLPKISFCKD